MSRRQAPTTARRSPEPAPPTRASRLLSPRWLLPALGMTTATGIALAILLGLGIGSGEGQTLTVTTCQGGTPGCELRAPTHLHSNLALIIRGESFDFSESQFLSEEGADRSPLAHLHAPRYGVVHVHRTGTSWDEFFQSIGFELIDPTTIIGSVQGKTCLTLPDAQEVCNSGNETFKFYVNGVRVEGIAFVSMSDLDRVLISYGPGDDAVVQQQVSLVGDDACIPSERCPERIPKDEPPEPCTKSNDTCVKPGG